MSHAGGDFFPSFDLITFVNYHILRSTKKEGKKLIISRQIPIVLQNEPSPRTWFTCFRFFFGISFEYLYESFIGNWDLGELSKLGNRFSSKSSVNYFHLMFRRSNNLHRMSFAGTWSRRVCQNSFHLLLGGFFVGNLDERSTANVHSNFPSPPSSKISIVIKLPMLLALNVVMS